LWGNVSSQPFNSVDLIVCEFKVKGFTLYVQRNNATCNDGFVRNVFIGLHFSGSSGQSLFGVGVHCAKYLAIRFNCPEGGPLNIENNVVRIEFELNGTYCTSDSMFASWTTGDRAWSASGTPIPIFFAPTMVTVMPFVVKAHGGSL
jgi:hypothetical protein